MTALPYGEVMSLSQAAGELRSFSLDTLPGYDANFSLLSDIPVSYRLYDGDVELMQGTGAVIHSTFLPRQRQQRLVLEASQATNYQLIYMLGRHTSLTPEPPPQRYPDDLGIIERTQIMGRVFDEENRPLDQVLVRARSLNSSVPFEVSLKTVNGFYAFNQTPQGVQIEITASKAGYATRKRTEVPPSYKYGWKGNRFDFGSAAPEDLRFSRPFETLSPRPEIIAVSPRRHAKDNPPNPVFRFQFSEPVDPASVERNFAIRSSQLILEGPLITDFTSNPQVWGAADFHSSWNADQTEVTFTFLPDRRLPAAHDVAKHFYQVGFEADDGRLLDQEGTSRKGPWLNLVEFVFERAYSFTVKPDQVSPRLVDLNVLDTSGRMALHFDEPMQLLTQSGTVASGEPDNHTTAPAAIPEKVSPEAAAENYRFSLFREGAALYEQVRWSALGGTARINANDTRQILLEGVNLDLRAGDRLEIDASEHLQDPDGNIIQPAFRHIQTIYIPK